MVVIVKDYRPDETTLRYAVAGISEYKCLSDVRLGGTFRTGPPSLVLPVGVNYQPSDEDHDRKNLNYFLFHYNTYIINNKLRLSANNRGKLPNL